MEFELTDEQEKAVRSLERALKKCNAAKVVIENLYGTLVAYDGNIVRGIDFEKSDYSMMDRDNYVHTIKSGYDFDSFCNDPGMQFLHLKDE